MISKNARVNPAFVGKQFDIGEKGVEKVITQSVGLQFVETEAADEIALSIWEDFDPHEVCRRISCFAFSQSMNFASPLAT
jgi:hypothetical protein